MSNAINNIILSGTITSINYFPTSDAGPAFCTFSIKVAYRESGFWVKIRTYRELADNVRHLTPDTSVLIQGRLASMIVNRDKKEYGLVVIANTVMPLDSQAEFSSNNDNFTDFKSSAPTEELETPIQVNPSENE